MSNSKQAAEKVWVQIVDGATGKQHYQEATDYDKASLIVRKEHVVPRVAAIIDSELAAEREANKKLRDAVEELLDWVNGNRRTSDDRLAEIELLIDDSALAEKEGM